LPGDHAAVTDLSGTEYRLAELRENLAELTQRIERACVGAGRDPGGVSLIAVTKTFPASDIVLLSQLGISDVGENRDQEAAPKAAECAALGIALTWHFVGQLQVNKVASVVRYADFVHSVDRERLVRALGPRARAAGRTITCLVQVSLHEAPGRGGAEPAELPALADAIEAEEGLRLGGVMAVAPLGEPPRPAFARLSEIAARLRADHPGATIISAGMSDDLADAIAEGATHVRVGTALLGGRRPIVR
jgi:pyridoxal phosphate enzyme (YggS family)